MPSAVLRIVMRPGNHQSIFMTFISRALLAGLACASLSACVTPSATYTNWTQDPKPPEADQYSDFLIGRFASLTNDPTLAAETYIRASNREPEDPVLLERAVFSTLLAGETTEAVRLARSGRFMEEDLSSLTRLTLGIAEMRDGDYDEALEYLTSRDLGPFNRIVARGVSAWAAVGEGDLDASKSYLIESLVGDDVLDGVTLYMLALVQLASGQEDQAISTFEAVWNEGMRLAVASEYYMRLVASRGDHELALKLAEQFSDDVGQNPSIEAFKRQLLAGDEIIVPPLSPQVGSAISVYALASALAAETRDDVASVYFNLALTLNPDLHIARSMLGSTLEAADRDGEAIMILNDVSSASPFYATSQGQLAWIYLKLQEGDRAVEIAKAGFEATGDRDLAIQVGDIYRSMDQFDRAFEWFDRVVTADEAESREEWGAYFARAVAYHELGDWDAAEADLLRAKEIDPDQALVLNYLGYSWVDRGEHLEEAFDLIRDAVNLRPNSGYIVDSLGWAYYRLGQFDQAVHHLERAVELSPDDPTLNDHLGDAYWRVGRELEARFQWRHALAMEPEADQVPLIEAKLENGLDQSEPAFLAEDLQDATIVQP